VRALSSHNREISSSEKPLIRCRIVLIDIDKLFGHEQVVRPQVDFLKTNLKRLGYFFRPILVVKKHNVVLDGHHRVEALKELGGLRIPCIEIEYQDNPKIKLSTWFPVYTGKINQTPLSDTLKALDIELDEIGQITKESFSNPDYGFGLYTRDGQWLLKGDQKSLYKKFLTHFIPEKFEYVKTCTFALDSVKNKGASFALLRKIYTKEDVLTSALSGNLFAPKTTRHILDFRYQDIKVPLQTLFD
jgi:hypothetical protein